MSAKSILNLLKSDLPLRSLVSAWRMRGNLLTEGMSGAALLSAIAHLKASNWKGRAAAYRRLGEIALTPEERTQARHLLSQALVQPNADKALTFQAGCALATSFLIGATVGLFQFASDTNLHRLSGGSFWEWGFETLGLIGVMTFVWTILSFPFTLTAHGYAAHRRSQSVQKALRDALGRLGTTDLSAPHTDPENETVMGEKAQEYLLPTDAFHSTWANKMASHSPVRRWLIRRYERTEGGSASALLGLLSAPDSLGSADLIVAYQTLREIPLSPAERTQATHLLSQALTPPRPRGAMLQRLSAAVLLALLAAIIVAFIAAPSVYAAAEAEADKSMSCMNFAFLAPYFVPFPVTLLFTGPLFAVLSLRNRKEPKIVRQTAAEVLALIGDPSCIVALYQQAHRPTAIRATALTALHAVIPSVTADWYGRMPSGASAALATIAAGTEEEPAMEALAALECAGSGSAATAVRRILRNGVSQRVRARAADVLRILIERRNHETSSASLLRPSYATSSANLLRPFSGAEPNISHLLRASERKDAG